MEKEREGVRMLWNVLGLGFDFIKREGKGGWLVMGLGGFVDLWAVEGGFVVLVLSPYG